MQCVDKREKGNLKLELSASIVVHNFWFLHDVSSILLLFLFFFRTQPHTLPSYFVLYSINLRYPILPPTPFLLNCFSPYWSPTIEKSLSFYIKNMINFLEILIASYCSVLMSLPLYQHSPLQRSLCLWTLHQWMPSPSLFSTQFSVNSSSSSSVI